MCVRALCSVYISCGWVAKASAVTGCQCDLWAHHTLSEPASHKDAQTHAHTRTHRTWTFEDEHTHTHAHISRDGQSHFIKLTPDQSQMHWRLTKTLSHRTHTYSVFQCITSSVDKELKRNCTKEWRGQQVTVAQAETVLFQFLPSLSTLHLCCSLAFLLY